MICSWSVYPHSRTFLTTPDMNMNHITCSHSVLASPSIVPPRCSGSSHVPGRPSGIPNPVHVRPTSWYSQDRALFLVFLLALVASPATVSAVPLALSIDGIRRRNTDSGSSNNSSGSISLSVWLPILLVTILFVFLSFVVCFRRCARGNAPATTTTAGQAASTPSGGNTARPRRRPHRTPSQISTKSLPPYMKEPGDHELVLYRGPEETEDDEHPEMHNETFDIALDRIESVDTMADSSTTNLIRRVSESVARPPELHHATIHHDHRQSMDARSLGSVGSDVELLPAHQRVISVDSHADPRGEAPSYTETVSAMAIISLNDPEPNSVPSNAVVSPSSAAGRGHSRFSFLKHNPFHSHNNTSGAPSNVNQLSPSTRSESPALHLRSGSALSRFSSHESHESRHSRAPSRNNLTRSHSRSNPSLFRAFRSHSPGLHPGSSTISLDSISAPLTHTLTRAEFHAPKGGLLTPEQVKLITSREALEKFGMPYGPDAVAAFSLSREILAEAGPPPDFESVMGEQQEQPGASDSGPSGGATEAVVQRSDTPAPRSTSLSPVSHPSSHQLDVRADSRASTVMSYATAPESSAEGQGSQAQTVQVYASEDESGPDAPDEPHTARPMTPRTARPLSLSRDHGSVARHP